MLIFLGILGHTVRHTGRLEITHGYFTRLPVSKNNYNDHNNHDNENYKVTITT